MEETPITSWRMALDERQRQHVAFCQQYVEKFGHGAPGHLDMLVIDNLARLLDGYGVTAPPIEEEEEAGTHVSVFIGGLTADEASNLNVAIRRNEAS